MTELLPIVVEDHLLWPDGTITVDPDSVISYIFRLSSRDIGVDRLYVSSITPDIEAYNDVSDRQLTVKTGCSLNLPPTWKLPEKYSNLDLDDYLLRLIDLVEKDELYDKRIERLATEIFLFKSKKLDDVLRSLIYIIDTMKAENIIWGVGRGSSCSSYLLYLLGLHEVDPVKFDIDIEDFLHV